MFYEILFFLALCFASYLWSIDYVLETEEHIPECHRRMLWHGPSAGHCRRIQSSSVRSSSEAKCQRFFFYSQIAARDNLFVMWKKVVFQAFLSSAHPVLERKHRWDVFIGQWPEEQLKAMGALFSSVVSRGPLSFEHTVRSALKASIGRRNYTMPVGRAFPLKWVSFTQEGPGNWVYGSVILVCEKIQCSTGGMREREGAGREREQWD